MYLERPPCDIQQGRRQLDASFVEEAVEAEGGRAQELVVEEAVEGQDLDLQLLRPLQGGGDRPAQSLQWGEMPQYQVRTILLHSSFLPLSTVWKNF